MNNKHIAAIAMFFVAVLAVIVVLITTFGTENAEEKVTIGIIVPGSIDEVGWNRIHYEGVKQATDELGVNLVLKQNAAEYSGLCGKAVEKMVQAGVKMIILGSYNYPNEVADIIKAHPEVLFFCCSGGFSADNYKEYFARVYQARYLSGIVAGMQTKTGRIGYVAAMNNSEVNRGINAFTLGVKRVNPNATVVVSWTNSWDDATAETRAVEKLVASENVDLVTYHQNQAHVVDAAESMSIYSVGYNVGHANRSQKMLTAVTTDWKVVYREFIQDYLQQKNSENNYWLGLEKDAVALSFYSEFVSDSTKSMVQEAILELQSGRDVFVGPIVDNAGKMRCDKDEFLSDNTLREEMDWFVAGVRFYEE